MIRHSNSMSTISMITTKLKSGLFSFAPRVFHVPIWNALAWHRYCKQIYQPKSPTSNVFLTLLRIYLRPTIKPTPTDLLAPALELISRHNPRLDPVETLNLLPPLVTAEDVRAFLIEALRAPIFDTRVVKHLSKARSDQVARRLMALQTRRVRVTDSRMWVDFFFLTLRLWC